MIEITDEDIAKVEEKFGLSFDDESRKFIKCLESKDIQACPGAGKTTSLVAKLDILSSYMPFEDNSGILVLTHTNVAVDEIKEKLGINGYPNHVGTFQSFIDKYLAIPMYIQLFRKRPERIDIEVFNIKLLEKLKLYYLDRFIIMSMNANNYSSIEYFLKALSVETTAIVLLQKNNRKKNIAGNKTPSYRNLKRALENDIIKNVISDGYLTYTHSYDLALKYLNDYPQMAEIFQKRFKYVFVDEAQDTDDKQFEIIDKLFAENTIIQKIGDNNQAIYNNLNRGWEVSPNYIEIKNTKRFSNLIGEQVKKIAIKPQELEGNREIEIQPTIILFKNTKEVLSKFGDLIVENGLHENQKTIFKAVGAVKKHDTKNAISDYFPSYQSNENSIEDRDTLLEKLELIDVTTFEFKDYRKIILDVFKVYLKEKNILNEGKAFTNRSIVSVLLENDEEVYSAFNLQLLFILEKIISKECVIEDIKELLKVFLDFKGKSLDEAYLLQTIKEYNIEVESKNKQNIYTYYNGDINFEIDVSTIHRVKGETHTATLVLETYNRNNDLFHLIKLLQGRRHAGANKDKKKLIYVAMSRPTHFLCLAIHKRQLVDDDIRKLEDGGFRVVEC